MDLPKYESLDTQVLGVSVDVNGALQAFAEKMGFTYPLLSDFMRKTSADYGVLIADRGLANRTTFVVDKAGKITWRYQGQMYSIGIGRTHTGTRVIVLAQDLDIRIINAATGELLRELVLDTSKRYQGTGRPPGPTR